MTVSDAIHFYEALLDCVALQCATGLKRSVFQPLTLKDPTLLGRARVRRADLNQPDQSVADWYFQLLIHGWLSSKGFGRLRDLRHDKRFAGKHVCDFMVADATAGLALVECKRVHPSTPVAEDCLSSTISKVRDRLPGAARQLRQACDVLDGVDGRVTSRQVFLDISAYRTQPRDVVLTTGASPNPRQVTMTVLGYHEDEVDKVKQSISLPDEIDKVTLCWRQIVFIEQKPHAIIHHATSIARASTTGMFQYDGWTVEGYPRCKAEDRELRVSTTARALAYIEYTYNNLSSPDHGLSWGPAEARE